MQEYKERNEEFEIDLMEIFHLIKHRIWLIILCGVIGASAMFVYTKNFVVPQYSATSKIYIFSDAQISSLNIALSSTLTQDFILLAQSRPVMEDVIADLDLNMSSGALAGCVNVSNPEDSHLLIVNVVMTDPVLAKDVANSMAKVIAIKVAEIMETDEPNIMEEAIVPAGAIDSGMNRNVILGALIGMIAVIGITLLMYLLDDTLKDEEDVEKYLGYRTLAAFPQKTRKSKGAV